MDSQEQPTTPESATKKEKEIIGIVTLGERDPGQMTKEEFDNSPDLLFHGSAKDVKFLPDYNYGDGEEYVKDAIGDGSTTLGMGFYATRVKNTAENYSQVRQVFLPGENKVPRVISLLPHQAQILDLRVKHDLHENGSFPHDLAVGWQQYYERYLEQHQVPSDNLGKALYEWKLKYRDYLAKVIEAGDIELRHFLQTDRYPSPPWSYLFSCFITEQGIDGLIYNEGGEGQEAKYQASYVFYNLAKIGTWESWQKLDK